MSHDEIIKINHRLDQHDAALEEINKQNKEILEQNKRQFQMLEPIYKIFTNVQGFNGISAMILKGIILLGAGVGVVYGLLKWLRQ